MPVDAFRLGFVPGVTPAKWVRIWQQRHRLPLELHQLEVTAAAADLEHGEIDMALLRPPVDAATVSAIPLYTEVPVVIAAKDHALAALAPGEEVTAADLAEESFLLPEDDVYTLASSTPATATGAAGQHPGSRPPSPDHIPGALVDHRPATTTDAITLVAAGTGLLIVPLSLARLHHRRDLVHRPLADGPAAQVLLAWLTEHYSDEVEDFIGVVRGRSVNSTRGNAARAARTPATKESKKTGGKAAGGAPSSARSARTGRPRRGARGNPGRSRPPHRRRRR